MKTIAKFTNSEEAWLLVTRLESAGIEAFVQHELFMRRYSSALNPLGGARVEVADEDEEAALAFIAAESE